MTTSPADQEPVRSVPLVPRALVTATAGRRARRVVQLAGASDWRRATIDSVASLLIGAVGTRMLPPSDGWSWPPAGVDAIEAQLADRLTALVVLGGVVPRQPGRERLSLLAEVAGDAVIVKLGRPGTGIEREAAALNALTADPIPCIRTPAVLADGLLAGDVAFVVTSALGLDGQRAAIDEPLRSFERDLGERLAALPRPADTPQDHVPVHGDLTPWNLRRTARGLALFDWEDAGWGPPGSDLAWYRRACESLPRRHRRR